MRVLGVVAFCSTLFPAGDHIEVALTTTGTKPFHFTCPGGASQASIFDTFYGVNRGSCETNPLSGDYAVTVTIDP
jgi:hypothetical protein